MIPIDPILLDAFRDSHTRTVAINLYDGDEFVSSNIKISGGSVKADAGQNVRRTLEMTIPLTQWDDSPVQRFNTVSSRVEVFLGYDLGGYSPFIPLGTFRVDTLSRGSGGELQISGQDLGGYVVDYDYVEDDEWSDRYRGCITGIELLIKRAFPSAVFDRPYAPEVEALMGVTLDYEIPSKTTRWALIEAYAARLADGAEFWCPVYCAPNGKFRVGYVPSVTTGAPVWRINEGEDGVLIGMDTSVSRNDAYNGVMVTVQNTDTDGEPVVASVVDIDPLSPTYWGGKFGKKMKIVPADELAQNSSSLQETQDRALAKAKLLLDEVRAAERTLNFSAIPNPALEPDDIVQVAMLDGTYENHRITSLTIPLGLGEWTAETMATKVTSGLKPVPNATYDLVRTNLNNATGNNGTYDASKARWGSYAVSGF